jgi:DNA-binding PadR family transcriptional regulator
MEKKLLLLGLLRMHEMHGYRLNELIDAHLGRSVQLTRPTAYNLLEKMAKDGWIVFSDEQEGNRPPRRVYSITPAGEAAFQEILRESLSSYKPAKSKSDIALAFIETLPQAEAMSLLRKRRKAIELELESYGNDNEQHHQGGFQLLVAHQKRSLKADLAWNDEILTLLSKKEK